MNIAEAYRGREGGFRMTIRSQTPIPRHVAAKINYKLRPCYNGNPAWAGQKTKKVKIYTKTSTIKHVTCMPEGPKKD